MMASDTQTSLLATLMAKILTFILKAFFITLEPQPEPCEDSTSSSDSEPSSHDPDDEHFNCNSEAALEAAFKYFGFASPEEATRKTAKKKYRKLSCKHHPDRNNQSEESVKEMQKINRYYQLILEEFDRREGNTYFEKRRIVRAKRPKPRSAPKEPAPDTSRHNGNSAPETPPEEPSAPETQTSYFQQLCERANFEPALISACGIMLGRYIFSAGWDETVLVILLARIISEPMSGETSWTKRELYALVFVIHCAGFVVKELVSLGTLFPSWFIGGIGLVAGCFYFIKSVMVKFVAALYTMCTLPAGYILGCLRSIAPPTQHESLSVALDAIVSCGCILFVQFMWGILLAWNNGDTLNQELVQALSEMPPQERAALFAVVS